jgi:hypothetical protein
MNDDCERPDVRAAVDRSRARLFRAHVGDCSDRLVQIAVRRAVNLGDPEIENLRRPIGQEDDVGGLDVAMDDPRFVRVSESARHLLRDRKGFIEREAAAVEARLQRFAIVERHGDEQLSVLGLPDLVDRADARVIEGGGGARFSDESRLGVRVFTQVRRKKFQCDMTAEPLVSRSVHDRHAPAPSGSSTR